MEKDREAPKDIREPFRPEDTPRPPQEDPTGRSPESPVEEKRNEPASDEHDENKKTNQKSKDQPGKGHLLNEQADIDDETTI